MGPSCSLARAPRATRSSSVSPTLDPDSTPLGFWVSTPPTPLSSGGFSQHLRSPTQQRSTWLCRRLPLKLCLYFVGLRLRPASGRWGKAATGRTMMLPSQQHQTTCSLPSSPQTSRLPLRGLQTSVCLVPSHERRGLPGRIPAMQSQLCPQSRPRWLGRASRGQARPGPRPHAKRKKTDFGQVLP